jgi:hypothetical protein
MLIVTTGEFRYPVALCVQMETDDGTFHRHPTDHARAHLRLTAAGKKNFSTAEGFVTFFSSSTLAGWTL